MGTLRLQWRYCVPTNLRAGAWPTALCVHVLQPEPVSSRRPSPAHLPTAVGCRKPPGLRAFSPDLLPRSSAWTELALFSRFHGGDTLGQKHRAVLQAQLGAVTTAQLFNATVRLGSIPGTPKGPFLPFCQWLLTLRPQSACCDGSLAFAGMSYTWNPSVCPPSLPPPPAMCL